MLINLQRISENSYDSSELDLENFINPSELNYYLKRQKR